MIALIVTSSLPGISIITIFVIIIISSSSIIIIIIIIIIYALTAVWSKAPPLIARCLSPLPWFESQPGHVGKLPVTWGQAVVFVGYSGFLHYLQLASHELAIIGINVTKNKIPNQIIIIITRTIIYLRDYHHYY